MEKAMAWTEITREHYRRENGVYASNTTDAEWGLIEPLMPGWGEDWDKLTFELHEKRGMLRSASPNAVQRTLSLSAAR